MLWTLSGDILTAELENLPFPNTQNLVTNWEWNYVLGKARDVKMGTNGRILTSANFALDFVADFLVPTSSAGNSRWA